MLGWPERKIVAFWQRGEGPRCRACTVKALGEPLVARIEAGLSDGPRDGFGDPEWDPMTYYEVTERATENGYECAGTYEGEPRHRRSKEGFCKKCAEESCWECGVRLDVEPEGAAAA